MDEDELPSENKGDAACKSKNPYDKKRKSTSFGDPQQRRRNPHPRALNALL
jgi:hypothetical protein